MPGGFQIGPDMAAALDIGAVLSSSTGTTLTAGTANVKGSWSALTSALPWDCDALAIELVGPGTGATGLLDIAIGPSGSEMVLFGNIGYSIGANYAAKLPLIPVALPAGTRIAARVQSATASQTVAVKLTAMAATANQMTGYAGGDSIGAVTASSQGTSVTASATANVKGSFTTLAPPSGGSLTVRDYAGLVVGVCYGSTIAFLTDIAIGASGSEIIIAPNLSTNLGSYMHLPIPIPKGTRLSARVQASSGGVAAKISILGLY